MNVIKFVVSIIVLCPVVIFFITYMLLRKKMNHIASFGIAADVITFILFFSVPLSISSLWGGQYSGIVFVIAILIAMVLTYYDWKTKKEIQLLLLSKKIWRVFFILFSVTYFCVWLVGLTQHIVLIFIT